MESTTTQSELGAPQRYLVREALFESATVVKAVDGDGRRWDVLPQPPAPGMSQQDLALLLTLYTTSPWVYAAVSAAAQAVASVRRIYYRVGPDGKRERATDTRLEKLLSAPNPFQSTEDLLELLVIDLRLIGWSFWEKLAPGEDGFPGGLWRLRPDRCKVKPDEERYWRGVEFEAKAGQSVLIGPESLVPFRHWSPISDYWPVSGMYAAQRPITWELFAGAWNTSFFRNGAAGLPEGVFETDTRLTEDTYKRIEEKIRARIGHPDVWRSILILDSGLKYRGTSPTQKDMQFAELMDRACAEILAALGTPPAVVGVAASSLGSYREQRAQFYQQTVLPLLRKIESTINRFLAPPGEAFAFDLADILSLVEDLELRMGIAERSIGRGVETINEVRAELGRPPVPWGDKWWAPLGLAPVESEVRAAHPATAEAKESTPERDEPEEVKIRRDLLKAAIDPTRRRIARRLAAAYHRAYNRVKELLLDRIRMMAVRKAEPPAPRFAWAGPLEPFTEAEFLKLVEEEVGEELLRQANTAAKVAARALGVDFREIMSDTPRWKAMYDAWRRERIGSAARTSAEMVRREAEAARQAGLTVGATIDRMSRAFDRWAEERVADLSLTDATALSNLGITVQGEGVFTHKQWVTIGDEAVRQRPGGEDHVVMHEKVIPLDEKFRVPSRAGFDLMDAPGDPAGSPENTCYCRCTLVLLRAGEV